MSIKHGKLLMVLVFFCSSSAYSECYVEDVIDMVDEDYSRREIREDCGRSVDVEGCSLSQVIRLAGDGYDEDDIYDECEDSSGRRRGDSGRRDGGVMYYCQTQYSTCRIDFGIGREGDSCSCPSMYGYIQGIAVRR